MCPISFVINRNRTSSSRIGYGLYLYFLGLSTRSVAKALSFLHIVRRSHVAVWRWIQKYHPKKMFSNRNKIDEFIIDETQIKVGSEFTWLWVAIKPKDKQILALNITKDRTCLLLKGLLRFDKDLCKVSVTNWWWNMISQAGQFSKPKHRIHFPLGKRLIERTRQHIKDRME